MRKVLNLYSALQMFSFFSHISDDQPFVGLFTIFLFVLIDSKELHIGSIAHILIQINSKLLGKTVAIRNGI